MEEKQSTPEIDLTYFFRPVKKGLNMVKNGLLNYVARIASNGILFFSVIILTTAAAYALRFIIKPSYKTSGILASHELPGKYCSLLVHDLNKLKNTDNVPFLAKNLNISTTAAATINNFEVTSTQDTLKFGATDSVASLVSIDLQLTSMQYLDSIQQGLVYYLENVPYALKRKEAKIHSLQVLKASIDGRLKNLDSLRKLVSQSIVPRSQGQGIILGEPINPVSIYNAEAAYFREQLNMEKQLKLIDNIEVFQPFQQLNRTNYPNYNKFLIVGFLLSLIATLVITPVFGKKPRTS